MDESNSLVSRREQASLRIVLDLPPMKDGDSVRNGLIENVMADPSQKTNRLILADWLEEHGEPEEAQRQRRIANRLGEEFDDCACAEPLENYRHLDEGRQTLGEIRRNGWEPKACKGRGYGKNDQRARAKRVAKRRKKKGYK